LVHQLTQIGEGALGVQASNLVRQVAERNGVTDIVWPNDPDPDQVPLPPQHNVSNYPIPQQSSFSNTSNTPDYAVAFRNAPVAMAIATLGGTLIDCNDRFTQVTTLTKTQLPSHTIFTLIDQEELTDAFHRISQWIFSMQTTNTTTNTNPTNPILLKSIVADTNTIDEDDDPRLQVCLSPIQETNTPHNHTNSLRYLCVTLVPRSLASTLEPLFFTDDDVGEDVDESETDYSLQPNDKNKNQDPTIHSTYYAVG
jgi:hypothetical protein